MARRKVVEPAVPSSDGPDAPPPLELVRCPWTRWNNHREEHFEEWLRQRQQWRESHPLPLPALFARDRFALHRINGLDPEVVRLELAAPRLESEWVQRRANRLSFNEVGE
jgi:hypothetical protein